LVTSFDEHLLTFNLLLFIILTIFYSRPQLLFSCSYSYYCKLITASSTNLSPKSSPAFETSSDSTMARKSSAGAPRKRAERSKATGTSSRVKKKVNQTPRGKAISEGLRRYYKKKRQEAIRIAQLPQSHYDRLSDEEYAITLIPT
jgi:hypothetical protein